MKAKIITVIVLAALALIPVVAYTDSYDVTTNQLTITSITLDNTTYTDVVITAGSLVSVGVYGAASSLTCVGVDSYNFATNQLTIACITHDNTTYTNLVITVGSLVSVGGVAPAAPAPILTLTPATCTIGVDCGSPQVCTATGGTPPYYCYLDSLAHGAPPMGMSIDLNGRLTGTPKSAGTYRFGVCVVDIVARESCKETTVTVSSFSGVYTGAYHGTGYVGGDSYSLDGLVAFSVSGTQVTVTEPLDGTAQGTASGTFTAIGNGKGTFINGVPCTFSGTLTINPTSGQASGSGIFNCSGSISGFSATGSGTWSANRQ